MIVVYKIFIRSCLLLQLCTLPPLMEVQVEAETQSRMLKAQSVSISGITGDSSSKCKERRSLTVPRPRKVVPPHALHVSGDPVIADRIGRPSHKQGRNEASCKGNPNQSNSHMLSAKENLENEPDDFCRHQGFSVSCSPPARVDNPLVRDVLFISQTHIHPLSGCSFNEAVLSGKPSLELIE